MVKKLSQRYDQLFSQIQDIEATLTTGGSGRQFINNEIFTEWLIKVKSLVIKTCGPDSEHIKGIKEAQKARAYDSNYKLFKRVQSVFLAAKDDFQGGFLVPMRNLVQAELFDSELEQAEELLASGYKGPAAVVAGIVLETHLKDLCNQNNITHAKLDKMNSELAKASVYGKLQQKRITALADIRNSAAHGDWESFDESDVQKMIRDVESFLLLNLA